MIEVGPMLGPTLARWCRGVTTAMTLLIASGGCANGGSSESEPVLSPSGSLDLTPTTAFREQLPKGTPVATMTESDAPAATTPEAKSMPLVKDDLATSRPSWAGPDPADPAVLEAFDKAPDMALNPEPASGALGALGLSALLLRRRRRRDRGG